MTTARVVIVMGVSGSGKSTVGAALASALGVPFADGDDFHPPANVLKMAAGHPLTDEDRAPWLDAIAARIDEWSDPGADGGVIACSALRRSYRDRLAQGHPGVVFAYLEVAPDVLATRLGHRHSHFMPASLLGSQLATLQPPEPDEHAVTVHIVHETTLAHTTAAILQALRAE